jgi:hypothetical protein
MDQIPSLPLHGVNPCVHADSVNEAVLEYSHESSGHEMMPQYSPAHTIPCMDRPATNNIMVFNFQDSQPAHCLASSSHMYGLPHWSGHQGHGDSEMRYRHIRTDPEHRVMMHEALGKDSAGWMSAHDYADHVSSPAMQFSGRSDLDLTPTTVPSDLRHIYFPRGQQMPQMVSVSPLGELRYNFASEPQAPVRGHPYAVDGKGKLENMSFSKRKQAFYHRSESLAEHNGLGITPEKRSVPHPPRIQSLLKAPPLVRVLVPTTTDAQVGKATFTPQSKVTAVLRDTSAPPVSLTKPQVRKNALSTVSHHQKPIAPKPASGSVLLLSTSDGGFIPVTNVQSTGEVRPVATAMPVKMQDETASFEAAQSTPLQFRSGFVLSPFWFFLLT